ncbi:hypothetical protein BH11PLA2_BH11PLA2_14860 [soil metagenome]
MDSQELRETFHRVNAYRSVTSAVRGTAGGSIFSGLFFGAIAYYFYSVTNQISPFLIIYFVLAVLEIGVGLWKKFSPSIECVLVDALFKLAFSLSILARQYLLWQAQGQPQMFYLFFGVWTLYDAYRAFQAYFNLRKVFVERPSASQMRYVADMIADIRRGDPDNDPSMLDFSREFDFKAQMLGELAFLVDRGGEVHVLDKSDLLINRVNNSPLGNVVLFNNPLQPIQLRESNWQNYCRWKGVPVA